MGPQVSGSDGHGASPASNSAGGATAPVGRGVALLGASNGAALVAGIVRQKIFAVFLGPAGFGALSLAVALFDALYNLARFGIPTGLLRVVSRAEAEGVPEQADRAYRSSRTVLLVMAGSLFLAVLMARRWVADDLFGGALPSWAPPVVAGAVPFLLLANLSETMLTARGALGRIALSKVATTAASLLLMATLVIAFGLAGAVWQVSTGAVVAALVAGLACRGVFRSSRVRARAVPDQAARAAVAAILVVGASEAVHHVAVSANLFAFRVIVARELGVDANGLYQVVLGLSRQWVPAVLGGVFIALYPRLASVAGDRRAVAAEVGGALRLVFVLGVPVVMALLATRDWIVSLLLTEDFRGVEALLRLSAPGDLAALLAGVAHMSLLALGAVRAFLCAGLAVELVYLTAVWQSIEPFAIAGPVGAYGLSAGLSLALYLALLRRHVDGRIAPVEAWRFATGLSLVAAAAWIPEPGGAPRWLVLAGASVWVLAHRRRIRAELGR